MERIKLSPAQHRLLTAAAAHKIGRVCGGDPRTRDVLIARGWIELDRHHYGPLFRISDAGRRILGVPDSAGERPSSAGPALTPPEVIPAGSYTAERLLEVARELGIRGRLVRKGTQTETREYPVRIGSGKILWWRINAPAAAHRRT